MKRVPAPTVGLRVFNAGGQRGQANLVAAQLGDLGFTVAGTGNDPLFPNENYFEDWEILGAAKIRDRATRDEMLAAIHCGIREHLREIGKDREGLLLRGGGCFQPRHLLRVKHEGVLIELLICFECGRIDVYENGIDQPGYIKLTDKASTLFNELLKKAKIPLSPG